MTDAEWKNARYKVYLKSLHDPEFRALCQTDPAAAILQASGLAIPDGYIVKFVADNKDFVHCFNLPPLATEDMTQDQEEELLINWALECTEGPP